MGVTPADAVSALKKWVEWQEEEKTKYIIEMVDEHKLQLSAYHFPLYPYSNYVAKIVDIEWDGADTVTLEGRTVRDSWYGTGCERIGAVTVSTLLSESPWFFDTEELENEIKQSGIKKTIEFILKDVKNLASSVIMGEDYE